MARATPSRVGRATLSEVDVVTVAVAVVLVIRRRCGGSGVGSSAFTLLGWFGLFGTSWLVVGKGMVVERRGVAWTESLVPVWHVVYSLSACSLREKLLEIGCGSGVDDVFWEEVVDGDKCEK